MKKIIIVISLVLVLAIGATAAIMIFKNSAATPLEKIENAIEKSIEVAEEANAENIEKNKKFKSTGSVELSADLGQLLKYSGMNMDLDALLKVYMDTENSKFAEELSLSVNNQTIIDALIALNNKNIAVKSGTILGNDAYGVTYADFFEKFDSSVFGIGGAYSMGVTSDELKEELGTAVSTAFKSAFNTVKFTAETEKLAEKFGNEFKEMLYTSLYANATFVETDGTLVIAGSEIQTTDVSIIFNEEQATTVALDVLKFLRDSEDFKTLFITCAEMEYSTYLAYSTTLLDEEYTVEDMYNDFIKGIDEEIESLNDEIAETDDETEAGEKENTITFTFRISKDNKEFIGLDTELIDGEEIYNMEFKFGPSAADIDQIVFVATNDDTRDNAEPEGVTLEYIVSEDSDDSYKASINISSVEYYEWSDEIEEDKSSVEIIFEWDKKEYGYTLLFQSTEDDETEKVTLGGMYKPEADLETLTITTVGAQGITLDIGEVKLVTRYSDTVPEISEFTEVLDMTEEDVDALVETFEQFAAMLEMFLG